MIAPNPPTPLANRRAQGVWAKRMGNPVAARPKNAVKSTACRYRCSRVKRVKKRTFMLLTALPSSATRSRSGILSSFGRPCFHLVISRADQPEQGVNHEKRKYAHQQEIHEQRHVVQSRIQLPVVCVGMRLVLNKARVRPRVAASAGLHQVRRRYR